MNFDAIDIQVTTQEILSKISEYDIFKKYIYNFIELEQPFVSELRSSDTANCRITARYNSLVYKDFKTGDSYDCWNYVMTKFRCNYFEALNIIVADFNIRKLEYKNEFIPIGTILNSIKTHNVPREKSIIQILEQPFTIEDYNYWWDYKIPLTKLEEYDVYSVKYCYLIKGTKRIIFSYSKNNPMYGYRFTRDGSYSYKIYWPLTKDKKYKWLFSGGAAADIEGLDCLPLSGDILILTKSLKDCISFNMIGVPAISLQGEANKMEQSLVDKLLKRFDRIITCYDFDEEGIKGAKRMKQQFGFDYFFIEEPYKDLAEYNKHNSLKKAKLMINDKINGLGK